MPLKTQKNDEWSEFDCIEWLGYHQFKVDLIQFEGIWASFTVINTKLEWINPEIWSNHSNSIEFEPIKSINWNRAMIQFKLIKFYSIFFQISTHFNFKLDQMDELNSIMEYYST